MGLFKWVSYREWSQLDSVESWEMVIEEGKESCNNPSSQQVVLFFHQNILGDITNIHIQKEYGVETMPVWFVHDTQI